MATEVILPKVDMDMSTGRISKWLVAEGAQVKKGDPLFEIETDKAAMEVESPGAGRLGGVSAKEGDDVPIGRVVAWILAEGEAAPAKAPATAQTAEGASKSTVNIETPKPAAASTSRDVRATPLARRIARDQGVDLNTVTGSGPHGRIVSTDVEALASVPAVKAETRKETLKPVAGEASADTVLVPHDTLRKTIARRLTESKSTVPHFYISADCRLDALLRLRGDLNKAAPAKDGMPAYKLSINDMVIKAWALALRDVPNANVSWTDAAMLHHAHADIGVAVSIEGGLITPIIRNAETKSLSIISNEMKDLATRAKTRKLKSEEYNGGSSAISNLGMFGVKEFAAIINPPHATILAVGGGEQRPIVENGSVMPATVMTVTLSTDHRAVDGALGAEVLAAFKRYAENPISLLV
jgi:pyruvate dehydrogenase E2 component (dihydrolipoamide acetyltransferase)